MKIVSLEAQNVKRLKAVHITPDGALVCIGGRNAQGKTSVLDSIMMALGGLSKTPAKPIREGEKEAEIRLDLGDIVVVRKFNEKSGATLTVTDGVTGAKVTSPQSILDKLMCRIGFDPLAFARMQPPAQSEELRKLLGLDFAGMDAERLKTYNERTVKNRELDSQKHRVSEMSHFPNAPEKVPDATEAAGRLEQANKWNEENRIAREQFEAARTEESNAKIKVADLERQLAEAKQAEKEAISRVATLSGPAAREDVDVTAISAEVAGLAEVRSQVEANQRRGLELQKLRALEKEARDMTAVIEKIDADKAKMIAEAKFPIDGLGFAEQAVTFNALPFSQASAAEQLRVSVAMGIAMNPKLKVLLIRDGSLLDDENLALIAKMAEEASAQVWIERVGKGEECSIIIEDGHVSEDRTKKK